ncbi:MAG: hypothetical protein KAY22_18610 [Rhizorhabdus sp.]|uniref:hypothetical protein n=1 Tax=Rhizorhabdus sp. TaxID=1968843 RepID=UPI001B4C3F7E|nr:hypothetical protein [Rhizorhabdus sp.]MBP8234312.1 hypothetical protein [Rhizorhabdus sp.]
MAQRHLGHDGLDDFPTYPFATRALCEGVIDLAGMTVWEPTCNRGNMVRPLKEYAARVIATDIVQYTALGSTFDFLSLERGAARPAGAERVDWVIANPPFRLLEEFIRVALAVAERGVAVVARTQVLEGIGRYEAIYQPYQDNYTFAQFVERVAMVEGRLDRLASTATAYGWLILDKLQPRPRSLIHIPPCRHQLEYRTDYIRGPLRPRLQRNGVRKLAWRGRIRAGRKGFRAYRRWW